MHFSPAEAQAIRNEFNRLANLPSEGLRAWLETPQSRSVGTFRRGESESVGRQAGRRILAIRATPVDELTDADYRHMKRVIGFCRRHLANRPWGDVTESRWRWSLMNWGHDPLRAAEPAP